MTPKIWRTTIEPQRSPFSIAYGDKVMFVGSCFAESISARLASLKFNVLTNPCGVIYNPYSVQTCLRMLMGEMEVDQNDLIFHNGLWHSFLHHSSFSKPTREELMAEIEQKTLEARKFFNDLDTLFVTLGTAMVYRRVETNRTVANCHKLPAAAFTRFKLTVCDIADEHNMLIESLLRKNPKLKIVFTVSPVRHWKDGAAENQNNKSILNVAVHQLCEIFEGSVEYFPSYEIMMDDLRDYRFYADDMLHPSPAAVDYIAEQVKETYLAPETQNLAKAAERIVKSLNHKPFNPDTHEHREFNKRLLCDIEKLAARCPSMDWSSEIATLQARLQGQNTPL